MDEQTRITEEKYKQVQRHELEWWRNNHIDVNWLWNTYLDVFEPWLREFECVVDIGCGPMPIFCSPRIQGERWIAVDPLFEEYNSIPYYTKYHSGKIEFANEAGQVASNSADGVFCLNALDHVQDPGNMLVHLRRILKPGGRLYLFVDIDKPTDPMHLHTIRRDWLLSKLSVLKLIELKMNKSWKFANDVMWYVGEERAQ